MQTEVSNSLSYWETLYPLKKWFYYAENMLSDICFLNIGKNTKTMILNTKICS